VIVSFRIEKSATIANLNFIRLSIESKRKEKSTWVKKEELPQQTQKQS